MLRYLMLPLGGLLALAAAAAAAPVAEIRVGDDGGLSVALEDAPLEVVLDALGAALEVEVVVDGSLQRAVSARFEGLEPARAVRRLVGSLPLVMRWTPGGELRSIRVRGQQPVVTLAESGPAAQAEPRPVLDATTTPPDPAVNVDAGSAERLGRRLAQRVRHLQADFRRPPGPADPADLAETLAEGDPAARRAAIRSLAAVGDGAAALRLGEALESETDPALRRLTLGALAGIDHPLARELVEAALE